MGKTKIKLTEKLLRWFLEYFSCLTAHYQATWKEKLKWSIIVLADDVKKTFPIRKKVTEVWLNSSLDFKQTDKFN